MASVLEEILPFDPLLSIQSQNLVTNRWNFMELILNIYVHGVVMHIKFCHDVFSNGEVIAL